MKTLFSILFLVSFSLLAQNNAELIDIGEGGVSAISKDGNYVCGSNWPNPPFLWSEATGRMNVGNIEGEGYSVSNNGIVVGRFRDTSLTVGGDPVLRAGYFANNQWFGFEGLPGIPPLDPQSFTHAYGISSEGTKAVGMVWHQNWRVEACYWSIPDTGIGLLGQTGGYNSRANAISNDESIIAGWDGENGGPDRRAFYWDPVPHFMGGFDPTYLVGESRGMNSDGSVIVGGSVWPFIWTEATGMQQVVADTSQYWTGQTIGVSDNGILVGYVDPGSFNYQAFVKMPGWSDILYLKNYIIDSLGITGYQNWYFPFAQGISVDGNRIGITAYPPGTNISHALVLTLDTTLPVELSSFSATVSEQTVQLNWTTITEKNNSGFEVQRRFDNNDWQVLGFVPGRGTTTEQSNYSFSDNLKSSGKFSYRLKQIDYDGSYEYSNIVEVDVEPVAEFALNQNYPNPFNPSTIISFSVAQKSNVMLNVYNILGEQVATLLNEVKEAGSYQVQFNAQNLTSGIYIYKLEAGNFHSTKKMMLLK
jgi:uncharacterized membrane protein